MPSTFTSNTGIEKIADGEQTGAWGQTTNDNFDIVDRALNGSVNVTLSGTTHTLTTSDGLLSDGQAAVLVFTGTPSGTNTVTIAPNTAQKTYFVTNTTNQSVVLSQGSGANVTVPTGRSAVVSSNGGGAAAAVVDLSAGLVPVLANAGVTATASELNILDGVTATTAELNILDGVTATTAEINYLDVTTLGTSQAGKVVTANANGDVTLSEELLAKSYNETAVVLTGTSPAVNCEAGNVFSITTSGNTTFTFTNPPLSGVAFGFSIKVTAGGSHSLTWPSSVDWPEAEVPAAPGSGETNVLVFFTHDGGITWYGFEAGAALA